MNNLNPKFFNHHEFHNPFVADLRRARGLVIIKSPYLTTKRIEVFREEIWECNRRGVRVCVVAQEPKDWEKRHELGNRYEIGKLLAFEAAMRLLEKMDVHVTLSPRVHEKLVVIDDQILWDGSMNILSYFNTKERMGRWVSRNMVKQVIEKHNLDLCAACSARSPLPLLPVNDDVSELQSRQLIGKCIARRRCELGMSQQQLGQASGMPQSVVSEIELGSRNVTCERLYGIAALLEIRLLPVTWHFTRKVAELMDYNFPTEPVFKTQPAMQPCATVQPLLAVDLDLAESESRQLIGKCIARRRCDLGLSQEKLGQASAMPQSAVSGIEQGQRNVRYDRLYRIAAALEMRVLPITKHFTHKVAQLMDYNFPAQPVDTVVSGMSGMPLEIGLV